MSDFREFCKRQIERLGGAFPEMRFYKQGSLDELSNWLEYKAAGDEERAIMLINEATEFVEIPSLKDLNAIWARLFPAKPVTEASPECPHCNGTGWAVIMRRGYEAAERCACGYPPVFDAGKPIRPPRLSATEIDALQRENHDFAARLAREMAGKVAKPRAVPLPTEADIAALKAEQDAHRKRPLAEDAEKVGA